MPTSKQRITITATGELEQILAIEQRLHPDLSPSALVALLVHPARHGRDGDVSTRLEAIGMIVSTLPLDPRALAHLRVTSGLRMPDCVVLACAQAHGLPVATFDERLRAAAERQR